jgi:hypothetical protein
MIVKCRETGEEEAPNSYRAPEILFFPLSDLPE